MILVDTNILVRMSDAADPLYHITRQAIAGCLRKGHRLIVSNQTLQEYWVVASRSPAKHGLGMAPPRLDRFLEQFLRFFIHMKDPDNLFDTWRGLVYNHAVVGIHSYDARLAAFVHAAKLEGFLTYNLQHFKKFSIKLLDPRDSSTW